MLQNCGFVRPLSVPAISTRERPTEFTPKPRVSPADVRQPSPFRLHRSKTTMDQPSARTLDTGSRMRGQVGEWQQRLPDVDPRLLQKVLRMQEQQKPGSRQSLRGDLLPNARRTVERWMETASEPERQVALRFFGSLAGGRLMGKAGEQGTRLKEVMEALQGSSRWVAEGGLSPRGRGDGSDDDDSARLRYINLLDGDTRRQRWMHTTWHHLPNYRLHNPVNNWSSHYVQPHRAQHRHFVIHPDWPPE